MSFLDHVALCNDWPQEDLFPFEVGGRLMGWTQRPFAEELRAFPAILEVAEERVLLNPALATPRERSDAFESLLMQLIARKLGPRRRGELYPVVRRWGEEPAFLIDRGAVPYFGTRSFGIHVNGFVRKGGELHIWVARRNRDKPVAPGKLDHIVAGGQPHGLGLMENLVKEAEEEASLPPEVALGAKPVGALCYRCLWEGDIRDDMLFLYDLELPEGLTPHPGDNEVESFELWPAREVVERVRSSDDFKFNVNLVLLDFFIRHGLVDRSHPEVAEAARRLYQPLTP
jgi:hypothetical protein